MKPIRYADSKWHLSIGLLLRMTIVVLGLSSCTLSRSAAYDLSTDDGVVKAYEHEMGADPGSSEYQCVRRPANLKDVIVVGTFVDDFGCLYDGLFVDGEFGALTDMTERGLLHNGWDEGAQRLRLARIWVEEVLLVNETILTNPTDAFTVAEVEFTPPTMELGLDGGAVVTLWVAYEAGQSLEQSFSRLEQKIAADGRPEVPRMLERFTVSYSD